MTRTNRKTFHSDVSADHSLGWDDTPLSKATPRVGSQKSDSTLGSTGKGSKTKEECSCLLHRVCCCQMWGNKGNMYSVSTHVAIYPCLVLSLVTCPLSVLTPVASPLTLEALCLPSTETEAQKILPVTPRRDYT